MKKTNIIPEEILKILNSITNKRAKIVIDHIIKHGFITTEQLKTDYGYDHPPRAARDVRESGIPLETFKMQSTNGRNIAAYKFGDFSKINNGKLEGRKIFPKELQDLLYKKSEGKCYICNIKLEKRYFQIDHRIPYEVAGDSNNHLEDDYKFMLLCSSCNRSKSWSCEQCKNWKNEKNIEICSKCYWCTPDDYIHIAMEETRRLEIVWQGNEIIDYEKLKETTYDSTSSLSSSVKEIINDYITKKNS
jgi:5-methylcytosine-specific restriction endonuclease McrA